MIINKDINDYLSECLESRKTYQMIFADPPDNIGLDYESYVDFKPSNVYYGWLETIIHKCFRVGSCIWLSYYWKHDVEVKHILRNIVKYSYPAHNVKTFFWRFTFGQYNPNDCGSGFRFLVRILREGTPLYPDAIKEPSARQLMGDMRADPSGRVPDDVWAFEVARVTGNSHERRPWCPTQHPEALLRKIVSLTTKTGDTVLDCFGGTGTVARVCKRLNRVCDTVEIDPESCKRIEEDLK